MRLAAVYIPARALPYIFGENHIGQILNLGGKYIYNVTETKRLIKLNRRIPNDKFIENFDESYES